MRRVVEGAVVAAGLLMPVPLAGQGYHVRVDSRIQSAAYRGIERDSVLRSAVEVGETGGFVTPDGYAATCVPGATYCRVYRPGPARRGGPVVTTADAAVWGLGIPRLSFHGTARVAMEVGDVDAWPGTTPAAQLLDGYLDYAGETIQLQAGRTHVVSRLGYLGFDGGKATARIRNDLASVTLYGGWGLARGVALPVTSPALNPLDDFQPRDRQLVAGVDAGLHTAHGRGRITYERQVDPRSDNFVSERIGLALLLQPLAGLSVTGGADYDLAFGYWGSAEATVGYRLPDGRASGTVGIRRYRPFFDLFTIWGVFSPVPYRAVFSSVALHPLAGMELRARGEIYDYRAADAATPLVSVRNDGWRWSAGGTYAVRPDLVVDAEYHLEAGPGSSSLGGQGSVRWQADSTLALGLHAGSLTRPLEFRFDESNVWMVGAEVEYAVTPRVRLDGTLTRYAERRDRPDAAAFDWNQLRASFGLRVTFGRGADTQLPPAILRIPMRDAEEN